MDCFLDHMDKVQAAAALNSIHATHKEAPSTQQHLSSVRRNRLLFPGGNLVMITQNLFFSSTEAPSTTLTYWLLPFSSSPRWHVCQQESPKLRGSGFRNG